MPNRCNRRIALLLALVIAGGCASAQPNDRAAEVEGESSPFVATLMAIFPGFFVHGAGNWYAGKLNRRDELLEREGLGLGCMAVGAGLGGLGYLEHVQGDKSKGVEMVLHRMGEAGSFIGALGFEGFGLVCFFDSWIRDMMEAGDAAEERNRQLRLNHDLYQPLKPDEAAVDSVKVGDPRALPSATRMSSDPR